MAHMVEGRVSLSASVDRDGAGRRENCIVSQQCTATAADWRWSRGSRDGSQCSHGASVGMAHLEILARAKFTECARAARLRGILASETGDVFC